MRRENLPLDGKRKIRILYFADRLLRGGIQSFLIDYIEHMDPEKVEAELLVLDDGRRYELEDRLEADGVPVHKLNGVWIKKPSDFPAYLNALEEFFARHHDYDVVHMNSSSKNMFVLRKAEKYGIPVRIAHSHSTGFQSHKAADRLFGNLLKIPLRKVSTHYFACSESAGAWMFGRKNVEDGRVRIVRNAIDAERFRFDARKREKMRKELDVRDLFVVGNVGRFTPPKNHRFLIRVFHEIHKICPASCLLLAGDGPLRNELEKTAASLGLADCVRFLGFREDREDVLLATDVFVFPSLYEGFPVTMVEAQASGLPCVVSEAVPEEAFLTDLVEFVPLASGPREWADRVLRFRHGFERRDRSEQIKTAGYDIHDSAKRLQEFYTTLLT